ncbi:MAG: FkbM family methyltransferase [Saccharolobus sp.]|uniref:FkbM family methyltransferase n=1 Tax=Saccharolobus sp. TaxID=2100761 RepID=UPI0031752B20
MKMLQMLNFIQRNFSGNRTLIKVRFKDDRGQDRIIFCPVDSIITALKDVVIFEEYDRLITPDDTMFVVDAGAHVGLYSIKHASSVYKIVALEPIPFNYRLLCINIVLNRLSNVYPLRAALWNEEGEVIMSLSKNSTTHSVISHECEGSIKVASITLKNLINMFGSIDLLKMDIEGAEYEVLSSCDCLSQVNSIIAELHPNDLAEIKLKKLLQKLRNDGFNFVILRPPPHGIPLEEALKRVLSTTDIGYSLKSLLLFETPFSYLYPHRIRLLYATRRF